MDPYPNLAATGVRLPRRRRVPFPEAQRVGALTVFQGDLVVQRPEVVEHAQQEEAPRQEIPVLIEGAAASLHQAKGEGIRVQLPATGPRCSNKHHDGRVNQYGGEEEIAD